MLLTKDVKVGELIRNRKTRAVWLVVGKNNTGLLVVNLMLKENPSTVMMVLPAHADLWQRDIEILDLNEWEKDIIENNLEIQEQVEQAEEEKKDLFEELLDEAEKEVLQNDNIASL
jgi:hypothetical protein